MMVPFPLYLQKINLPLFKYRADPSLFESTFRVE